MGKEITRKSKNSDRDPPERNERLLSTTITPEGVREDTRKASTKNSATMLSIPLEGLPKKLKEEKHILKYESTRGVKFRELPPEEKPKARHGDETRLDTLPARSANEAWDRLAETETETDKQEPKREEEMKKPEPELDQRNGGDKLSEKEKLKSEKPNESGRGPKEQVSPVVKSKSETAPKNPNKDKVKEAADRNNLMRGAKPGDGKLPPKNTKGMGSTEPKHMGVGGGMGGAGGGQGGEGGRKGGVGGGKGGVVGGQGGTGGGKGGTGGGKGGAGRLKRASSSSESSSGSGSTGSTSSTSSGSEEEPEVGQRTIGVIPPRAGAFQAPIIRLPQPGSCAAATNLEDEEGLTFGFEPRPNFRTEVTFTIEPKKPPMWKSMMGCGFQPVIYCSVPPTCLSGTQPQQQPCCPQIKSNPSDCSNSSSEETSCSTCTSTTECTSSESDVEAKRKVDTKNEHDSNASTYTNQSKSQAIGGGDITNVSPVPSAAESASANSYRKPQY